MKRLVSIITLAVLCIALYGRDLGVSSPQSEEGKIAAQASALARDGGRDSEGRLLPLLLHASDDTWLEPVPVYSTALLNGVTALSADHARWASVRRVLESRPICRGAIASEA